MHLAALGPATANTTYMLRASISVVALSFIVHDPSGIIEWHRDRSLFSSRLRYLSSENAHRNDQANGKAAA